MSELNLLSFEKLQPRTTKSGKTRSDIAKSAIRKGKNGERFCAQYLSEISGLSFIRIPNSGARVGKTNRERIFQFSEDQIASMLGDIYCPPKLQDFWIIESKNYASFPFKKLSKGQKPAKISKWLDEIIWDTITYVYFQRQHTNITRDVLPFLIIKITHENAWVVYNKEYFIKKYSSLIIHPEYTINHDVNVDLQNLGFGKIWIMENFKQFFINNKWCLFKNHYE